MTALRLIRVLDVPKGTPPRPTLRAPCPHTSSRSLSRATGDESGRRGTSLVETLVVLALVGVLAMQAAPGFVVWRQQQQLEGAIRHLALEMARVCARAVASGRTHALRFDASGEELRWVAAVDGDGDGVSVADLDAGVDATLGAEASLGRSFPGVLPGRPPGVPTVAGGAADRNGLAFGRSPVVSCSATGGARSGTLYLRSVAGNAAALRVYGPTARLSLWWWEGDKSAWHRLR